MILIQLACSKCGFFYHPCVTLQGFPLSLAVDYKYLCIVFLRVCSTSNRASGNKQVIFITGELGTMVIMIAYSDIHIVCVRLVGASLSEPHTSVTALRTCVCMYVCMSVCLRPYTENFKRACLNFNITKIELGV